MRSLSLLLALLLTWLLTSCAGVGAAAGVSGRAAGSKGPLEYDFQGWRTRTISPTEDRTYVWGIDGIEAEGPTGGALAQHTRGVGMTLAVGNEVFGHDALGSVVMRVPTSGAASRTAYDAWGGVRATPSTGPPLGATGDRVGFTGHSNDPTGLVYAQQRWLDPTTGRFLSLDPVQGEIGMPLSTQGWTYANGMPTRFTDPDGRCVVWNGGTNFGTDFAGCAKTHAGFSVGVGRAVGGIALGAAALLGGSLSAQASLLSGGRIGSTEMMEAVADGIIDGVSHPIDTASSAANSVASKLIAGVDRGDYFAVGATLGETTTHTVTAAAGAAAVLSKVATTVAGIANIGESIASSAMQGFARGVGEVGSASTSVAEASTTAATSRLAGIATTWSEGASGPRQLEMFSEAETISAAPKPPTTFVRFEAELERHLAAQDLAVKRSRGIGGAHNADAFNSALSGIGGRTVGRTPHPSVPGIERIDYQIPALDRSGNPIGVFKEEIFSKTVYDPAFISDATFAQWGRQAAAEAAAAGRLAREWTGTAPNGVTFRGYLGKTGAVRSFFVDF